MKVLFLLGDTSLAQNDNHARLPAAFARQGWEVATADHDSVCLHGNELLIAERGANDYDLIWLLGFGSRASFLDRMQLLRRIDQRRFVNPIDAYVYLHSKLHFTGHMPETHAAGSAESLIGRLDDATRWVVKPSAASYGQDVFVIDDDRDGRARIREVIDDHGFAVLQRYVREIVDGEIRFLMAAGESIGCYKRLPHGMRANLAQGATPVAHTASPDELELVGRIGAKLKDNDIGFAAVDIAGSYLIEVNVVNPGGLGTLHELTGEDLAPEAVRLIVSSRIDSKHKGIASRP